MGLVLDEVPSDLVDEVVVVNNNSSDETARVAADHGATVLEESFQGYGAACLKGIRYLAKKPQRPDIVVFLDADHSDHPDEMISDSPEEGTVFWLGATLYEPSGEEMSAYGLDFDRKGVAVGVVPQNSRAWKKGFRSGDFITGIDKQDVVGIEYFLKIVDGKYAPLSSMFKLYRNQEKIQLEVNW